MRTSPSHRHHPQIRLSPYILPYPVHAAHYTLFILLLVLRLLLLSLHFFVTLLLYAPFNSPAVTVLFLDATKKGEI